MKLYGNFFKRVIDLAVALVVFIMAFPFFLLAMILLWIVNKGTPFFFQQRPGKNEKVFTIIKFKTMNDRRGLNGELLPDEERLSRVGKLVRKTSLDEVPQLINVIKGDMSLIGPRPLLVEYLPLYTPMQKRRHEVRPGITGWAQINGRNAISWEQKFYYDVWYVDHLSLRLDVKVLWMTIMKVIKFDDVNQKGHVTMEKFKGSAQ
jgi:lipopolysaccharide/colanic/teichoic acid biosynthesis glycosyltransferase